MVKPIHQACKNDFGYSMANGENGGPHNQLARSASMSLEKQARSRIKVAMKGRNKWAEICSGIKWRQYCVKYCVCGRSNEASLRESVGEAGIP